MAWFVSRRNCPSFLTANTVAGPLDHAYRSGRATGDHQDPPTTLLLHRRTAHPLGAPPHPASSPALALEKPVQSRPGTTARHPTPGLTALSSPDPLTGQPIVPANSHQLGPRGTLPAYRLSISPPMAARPPSSGQCGCLTPPSSPSIGIGPGPFAFPYPSSLVSTTGTSRFGGFGLTSASLPQFISPNRAFRPGC